MTIRPIHTDDGHAAALRRIEELWGAEPGSPDGDELDVLATLVEAYENRRWPVAASAPLEILLYAVTDMGHTEAELAEIVGSPLQASELLSGKRTMTVEEIRAVSRAWRIPADALIGMHAVA